MEEYTVLREGIARFKEDLAKSQEQIQNDINEVEKNAIKKLADIELNLSNAIEIVKKDNAEFKLEITKQLKNSSNGDGTALRELENIVNSFKNTTNNTLATIQEDIRQLKSRPTTAVQENTWEII